MTTLPEQTVAAAPSRAAWMRPTMRHYVLAAAIAVALIIPQIAKSFVIFQLTEVMIYGLAILGLNLLTGFNGQFSLGHSAFYGIGAYTAAILMHNYDVAYIWTLPAAGAVCFIIGFLFGLPALRLQNLYLALATFALAIAVPQILKYKGLEGWTGGVQGLSVNQPDAPAFLQIDNVPWLHNFARFLTIDSDQWLYYFTLIVVLIMFGAAANLIHSRSGRAVKAIRDNPIAAAAMGVNTSLYKTLTFGVSALYTGVAGALSAMAVGFVAPDSFNFLLSVSFLVGLVIGGVGSIPGCLFGGLFVLYVPNIANSLSSGLAGAIYGVILLVVIFVIPAGGAGVPRMARQAHSAYSIERVEFFPLWFIVSVVAAILEVAIQHAGWAPLRTIVAMIVVALPAAAAQLYLAVKRLRDIATSPWWSLVLLVPGVNIILLFVLFFAKGRTGNSRGPAILAEGRVTP